MPIKSRVSSDFRPSIFRVFASFLSRCPENALDFKFSIFEPSTIRFLHSLRFKRLNIDLYSWISWCFIFEYYSINSAFNTQIKNSKYKYKNPNFHIQLFELIFIQWYICLYKLFKTNHLCILSLKISIKTPFYTSKNLHICYFSIMNL